MFFKESDEQKLNRISKHAGTVLQMITHYFTTPRGVDATKALIFTASLAGHACHRAVIAEHGTFAEVTTKDGRKFYFGDDLNKYLLESPLSVVALSNAVTGFSVDKVIEIVKEYTEHFGEENFKVCEIEPKVLFDEAVACWDGIYDNMTSKYCKNPSEWPILFGIVLQNILMMCLKAGAPKDEAGKIAVECAVAVSKMDKESC